MTAPNSWTDFLALSEVLDLDDLYETRMENDDDGNVIYVGYNMTANADTAVKSWYLLKCEYDGNGNMNRKRLPDDGGNFIYSWDDRAAQFS